MSEEYLTRQFRHAVTQWLEPRKDARSILALAMMRAVARKRKQLREGEAR